VTALFKIIELNIVMSVVSDFMKMPSSENQKCLKYLQKECLHITQLIVKLYNLAFYVFVKFRAE